MSMTRHAAGIRCAGVSLVEVLMALTIIAVAMIGMVALLIEGQASHSTALHGEQATALLADIAAAVDASAAATSAWHTDRYPGGATRQPCAADGSCDPQSMAEHQLADWQRRIATRLPPPVGTTASGTIVPEPAAGAQALRATIQWGLPSQANAASASAVIIANTAGAP
jgi:Tfp pilus assembly protein PilV